jgi:hypothetical protein
LNSGTSLKEFHNNEEQSFNNKFSSYQQQVLVEKLQLQTRCHPHPYRMQWLNDCGSIKVSSSVRVPISVGEYVDEVECDVVPMHACHLMLGRPWLHDRDVQISRRANCLCFNHGG